MDSLLVLSASQPVIHDLPSPQRVLLRAQGQV